MEMFSIGERNKIKRKFGGTRVGKAEEVIEYKY